MIELIKIIPATELKEEIKKIHSITIYFPIDSEGNESISNIEIKYNDATVDNFQIDELEKNDIEILFSGIINEKAKTKILKIKEDSAKVILKEVEPI